MEVALDCVTASRSFLSLNSRPLCLHPAFQLIQALLPFLFQRVFTEDFSERYCVRADAGEKKKKVDEHNLSGEDRHVNQKTAS